MSSLTQLDVHEICMPFRFKYGHAKATHKGVSSIVCVAHDSEGRQGLGEAVPRQYVTGETCESVREAIRELVPRLLSFGDELSVCREKLVTLAAEWDGPFPSCALCALEGALLDVEAQQKNVPLNRLFGEPQKTRLEYSGSLGTGKLPSFLPQVLMYKVTGLKQFKLKVGRENDLQRIALARKVLGDDVTIFADANAVWGKEEAVRKIEALHQAGIWAIEEPLRPGEAQRDCKGQLDRDQVLTDQHYQDYAWLRARSPIPIIADESLISLSSLSKIIDHEAFDILNIRLSKCGGFALSSHMVELARQHDLTFSVCAMVGESPVLALEGAQFGALHSDYRYIQGYSHTLLHRVSLTNQRPRLHHGGVVIPGDSSGLGLTLNPRNLQRVLISTEKIAVA